MFRARRRFRGGRGKSRRSVDWGGAFWFGETISYPAVADFADFNLYTLAYFWALWPRGLPDPNNQGLVPEPDDTLVRTLSNVAYTRVFSTSNTFVPSAAMFGLIKWSSIDPEPDPQLAIGGFPNPFDSHLDWVWRNPDVGTVVPIISQGNGSDLVVQSRAQRRFREGEGLLAVVAAMDFSTGANTTSLTWMWDIRCAVKKAV